VETSAIIDDTIATWKRERPDLDFGSMDAVLRMGALAKAVLAMADEQLAEMGVNVGEFDVLATLRRHGAGAVLTPTEIADVTMISPSGLTNRLARLERMGLVTREADPDDRRSLRVRLAPKGRRVADRAIALMAELDDRVVAPMSATTRSALERGVRQMLEAIDGFTDSSTGS
jgi:DNA-binding MarR family transcriptional regulator